ncbi:hypothetical protein HELRODRAFT_164798 [Helobdella robusta]|uniref:Uncharacterized protein n=1 Tax=Helobdella robusta TaxID=6412 RepID=T1EVT6_HELRO|nr:hypothetical protein HELRODRAFT_164798 [Helobdella robusta]ESN92702.1 hypothetical protein HELRODRAFT_164798 [Helobdella robusta]
MKIILIIIELSTASMSSTPSNRHQQEHAIPMVTSAFQMECNCYKQQEHQQLNQQQQLPPQQQQQQQQQQPDQQHLQHHLQTKIFKLDYANCNNKQQHQNQQQHPPQQVLPTLRLQCHTSTPTCVVSEESLLIFVPILILFLACYSSRNYVNNLLKNFREMFQIRPRQTETNISLRDCQPHNLSVPPSPPSSSASPSPTPRFSYLPFLVPQPPPYQSIFPQPPPSDQLSSYSTLNKVKNTNVPKNSQKSQEGPPSVAGVEGSANDAVEALPPNNTTCQQCCQHFQQSCQQSSANTQQPQQIVIRIPPALTNAHNFVSKNLKKIQNKLISSVQQAVLTQQQQPQPPIQQPQQHLPLHQQQHLPMHQLSST